MWGTGSGSGKGRKDLQGGSLKIGESLEPDWM